MKQIKNIIQLLVLNMLILGQVHAIEPYPLEYFAKRFSISNVEISPDGTQLALLRIPSTEANPILEIYQTDDLAKQPFRLNADHMEITGYGWLGDKDIIVNFRQQVREKIDGFNRGTYEYKIGILNLRSQQIKAFDEVGARIVNLLPAIPDSIIIGFNAEKDGASKVPSIFRPTKYYQLNLKTGTKRLIINAKLAMSNINFDSQGNPRIGSGFDVAKGESVFYYRGIDSKNWEEIYRLSQDSYEEFNIQAIDNVKADTLLVVAQNGENTKSLWEFDVKTKKFGEKIYGRSDVDVNGVFSHSDYWNKPDEIAGLSYSLEKRKAEFFVADEAALYKQLESIVPNAYDIRITSRAKTNNNMTLYNSGPHDPGSYYLVKDNKLSLIGSKNPEIKGENLADVKYITYKARDGKIIPAFITIPHGEGPFPTIVLPHGGPFVGEVVAYDEWGQMLANNGYLVLQPQYRGSRGYGLEFYQSAFIKGGQGGYAMQDDKDDGVKYLIDKGYTDPKRVAMFGWSYGGYAALVAASRTEQLYQCVIAGAAVSDPIMQVNYYKSRLEGASKTEQVNMWQDSISPIKDVAKVNIPILLIHGSADQRVPTEHAKKYVKALKDNNKKHQYLELDGADHFSNTLFYRHKIELYTSMIEYLKHNCGADGL